MVFHLEKVDAAFTLLAKVLRYTSEYTDAEQARQFIWMLNYYLPIYLWSRREGAVTEA